MTASLRSLLALAAQRFNFFSSPRSAMTSPFTTDGKTGSAAFMALGTAGRTARCLPAPAEQKNKRRAAAPVSEALSLRGAKRRSKQDAPYSPPVCRAVPADSDVRNEFHARHARAFSGNPLPCKGRESNPKLVPSAIGVDAFASILTETAHLNTSEVSYQCVHIVYNDSASKTPRVLCPPFCPTVEGSQTSTVDPYPD
jgi:hypothetical protein